MDDWSNMKHAYNLPPINGNIFPGNVWVLTRVYKHREGGGEYRYVAYGRVYGSGHTERHQGSFGETMCRGTGCWVRGFGGRNMFVTESVYNAQSNATKAAIDRRFRGVVPNRWQPFHGDPNNPYDVTVENRGIVWGYTAIHFSNMSKIDGEFCISSVDDVHIHSGRWVSFNPYSGEKDGWWRSLDSVKSKTTHTIRNGVVTARQNVTVRWHYGHMNSRGELRKSNRVTVATFTDSAIMPRIVSDMPNATVALVCYNNSVQPYTTIDIMPGENVTSVTLVYRNTTSTYHYDTGFLKSEDDIKYFEFVENPIFVAGKNQLITIRSGYFVVNEAPINESDLKVFCSTPYVTREITEYDITVIHSSPEDFIHAKTILAVVLFIGLLVASLYSALSWRRKT